MFQRAMNTGSFPETIWDVSKTPPLDPAYVDPIWDGSQTFVPDSHHSRHVRPQNYHTGSVHRNSSASARSVRSDYANFPMSVFATTHSEDHPIVSNDQLAYSPKRVRLVESQKREVKRPAPSRPMSAPNLHRVHYKRTDYVFAKYKNNPMTVL